MNYKFTFAAVLFSTTLCGQVPIGVPPSPYPAFNAATTQNVANYAWYRGGNTPFGSAGFNNIFGTAAGFNSPIFMQTNGGNRIQVNHRAFGTPLQNYGGSLINPLPGTRLTRIGISRDGNAPVTQPLSLLHIGYNSPLIGVAAGYRSWQDIGTMYMAESDNFYVGLRQKNPGDATGRTSSVFANPTDAQDAVISWGDNFSGNGPAPDNNLAFIFHAPNGQAGFAGSDYGREVMRMNGDGNVGIGPVFFDNARPQNMLHINNSGHNNAFMQVSNTSGTGQTVNDGLYLGYPVTAPTFLTAHINQKENDNLLLLTNNGERFRISQIGNISIPNMNPGNLPANTTRVAISQDPNAPVTRPLSLLHIGYNTQGATNDGWRPWMNVGMYVSQSSDHVFLGLKNESTTPFGDRLDAVLSWGDNQVNSNLPPNNGPDNFRFIFTSSTAGSAGGTAPATGANGLEGMRLTPTLANGVFTGVGGEPVSNPYSGASQNPTNTLEVNSWGATTVQGGSSGLRFTNLTTASPLLANPGTGVLSVNAQGDVIYVPGGGSTTFGNVCGTTQNPLTSNWEIPTGGNNYVFTGTSLTGDRVGIGITGCAPVAKLQVENVTGAGGAAVAGLFRNTGVNNNSVGYSAVVGISNVTGTSLLANIGGQFNASGAAINNIGAGATATGGNNAFGVNGSATNGVIWSVAGKFDVVNSNSPQNYGINSNMVGGTNASSTNYGASFYNANAGVANIGVQGVALNATNNYAIYGSVNTSSGTTPPSGPNYAGYFNGDVVRTGTDNFTSDLNLKQNIDTITDATGIIAQLKPKSFDYQQSNYPSMNLPSGKQYGLIAQDVQLVLPELVNNNVHPAVLDSAGNIVTPAVNFLSLEYQQLIGIMLKGMQEQQHKIDSLIAKTSTQDSINQAVQNQIAALAAQVSGCCSNANARAAGNQPTVNQLDVELSDKDAIVLNQNVPNPFAEQTVITYNVPESVGKAQLIFYNSAGQIIQTVDIKTRGRGKVNVFANDLSSGLYHYTLVADGKVVDSKKMVRE